MYVHLSKAINGIELFIRILKLTFKYGGHLGNPKMVD
jgi:hypothetical protein